MWPFTNSNVKETTKITDELPDNLKDFFKKTDLDAKTESIFEPNEKDKIVDAILQEHNKSGKYSHDLDMYKRTDSPRKVLSINCAEIQKHVIDCLRGWTLTKTTYCQEEMNNNRDCVDIQRNALKNLYYDSCIDVTQCNKIRYIIDKLFIENFGQYGDNINEASRIKFDRDINNAFYKIWK
ncbi:uncharacterized protein PRCAT00001868001 [Priceomyces carsonii]|uniref:uncharacterized protein n=1 Tax=Priceomyces carsonii TaxID=28549 RepID=UPI002EDBB005|nr:unnamed protein product [Priceomyces carsonii]